MYFWLKMFYNFFLPIYIIFGIWKLKISSLTPHRIIFKPKFPFLKDILTIFYTTTTFTSLRKKNQMQPENKPCPDTLSLRWYQKISVSCEAFGDTFECWWAKGLHVYRGFFDRSPTVVVITSWRQLRQRGITSEPPTAAKDSPSDSALYTIVTLNAVSIGIHSLRFILNKAGVFYSNNLQIYVWKRV